MEKDVNFICNSTETKLLKAIYDRLCEISLKMDEKEVVKIDNKSKIQKPKTNNP